MSLLKEDINVDAEIKNRPNTQRNPNYWVSLEEYNKDPKFQEALEAEFQSSPLREGEKEEGWARREFLKLMGASVALASAGCVRRPVQKIVPYNKRPEEITLGADNYYSSTYFDGSEMLGVLVKTREGRPIKIEANPKHPYSQGGLSARSQAMLLNLYDPERLQGPKLNLLNEKRTNKETVGTAWEDLDKKVVEQLTKGSGVVLTGSVASPSLKKLIDDFSSAFNMKHVSVDFTALNAVAQGQKSSYGEAQVPRYRYDLAKMIVSVDADFLGTWMSPTAQNAQFVAGRKDIKNMSRLVSFDSNYSLTGANADFRLRIKPSQQLWVVMGLLYQIVVKGGHSAYASQSSLVQKLKAYDKAAQVLGISEELFSQVAKDLWKAQEKALVVAGGVITETERSEELQLAVNLLNSVLGADGTTVDYENGFKTSSVGPLELQGLLKDMKDGKVKTLIVHGVNPAYILGSVFVEASQKVEMMISTSDRHDETAQHCQILAPAHHPMEDWGDLQFTKSLFSISQPTLRPMYNTRSFGVSLMSWAKLANKGAASLTTYETYYDFLRAFWKAEVQNKSGVSGSFEDFWDQALQDGFVGALASGSRKSRSLQSSTFEKFKSPETSSDIELAIYPTVQLGDGTYANVPWMQELPDPVTKIVWDNYLMISPKLAEQKNYKEGTLVEFEVEGQKMTLPIHIQPGLHDQVAAVALGYGRTHVGKVGNGIGKNIFQLVNWTKPIFAGVPLKLVSIQGHYDLACTQGHFLMEGRQIVVEATLSEYLKKADANIHRHHMWSIWSGHQYNGHKWGMVIDLNSCTGCSACMTACQSENNIPVVGKKYVLQGREMHWIRIDRYYSGDPENPTSVFHPVTCQH
ncbi:MAG TPA: TAT-variant-translocated molybdopterin oxidoreductase, partial [Pseudobdellovibrionaceae bacterium]|nr:TAT-variant-translocated molybdopterin oxidoreductase [Pseudobdellovibrionaceae bacterium]